MKITIRQKKEFKNERSVKVVPGLYPQEAEKLTKEEIEKYVIFLEENKNDFELIGEVGLDKKHTKDKTLFDKQIFAFKKMIELAIKLDKPLSIHTRNAEKEVLKIIEEYKKNFDFNKFILHCFFCEDNLINKVKKLNVYISIPHIVKSKKNFQNLVKEISLNKILVETDSPYLHNEYKVNTPLSILETYKKIAEIKKVNESEIENIIYKNLLEILIK